MTSYKMDEALERLEEIDNNTKPRKRKPNKAQILRDPVPNSMLEDIVKNDKPKGYHQLTWFRFQLTSVILFFSGPRINEITCINKEMIQSIIDNSHMDFYQSKVKKYRTIRFTEAAVNAIKDVFIKTEKFIFEHNKMIFPLPLSEKTKVEKFTKNINKFLAIFAKKHKIKVSSHSFRIAYVTKSLNHTTAHKAQQLIGHADIRSTMKYSRYMLDVAEEKDILDKMFDY